MLEMNRHYSHDVPHPDCPICDRDKEIERLSGELQLYREGHAYRVAADEIEWLRVHIRAALAVWDSRVQGMNSDAECCKLIVPMLRDALGDGDE